VNPGSLTEWEGVAVVDLQRRFGIPLLEIFATTASTNDDAARLAEQGASAGATVIAERQTAGRGRRGREWASPAARSILMSVIFRSRHREDASTMPLRIGLAVVRALRTATAVKARIKWPNDIVVGEGAKIGGILCEGATTGRAGWLIAGIGINVLQRMTDLEAMHGLASSIALAGGIPDRLAIVEALLNELRPFEISGPPLQPEELAELDRIDALRGRRITLDGEPAGVAAGIAPDGSLAVDGGGTRQFVRTGTIRDAEAPKGSAPRAAAAPETRGKPAS
jgi:BirA family transcriptional regulator, biotin operon repressor / biotin---[acetyl-CoA-carboxylase] ligase